MAYLSLSFLGRFEVILDAEPVTAFGSDKVRALLAYLAIESVHPHRRAKLAGMFWPELTEKKAAHNLSQSLLRLRQALGEKKDPNCPPVLTITSQHIQFNSCGNIQLDVARFRELLSLANQHKHPQAASCGACAQWLRQAAELYKGNLLAGLFISDSTAFEEWRLIQQEELHRYALETLARLGAYHLQRGDLEQAQDYARRQIALEPWREEAHLQLMRILAQSGQTRAALQQYGSYQRMLAEELNLEPSAEATRTYEQIRSGELGQQPPGRPDDEKDIWLAGQGELRQVTILVCSCPGAGNSAEGMEPLKLCEQNCSVIFNRFGGRRALRQGNNCLVYFGYPQAFEDAARRAVHSGLELASVLQGKGVRIGIHTGMIAVGRNLGPRWQDRDLSGPAFEIALNCQRRAKPGEVLITENTKLLVQDSFYLQELEQLSLDATGALVRIYAVRGEGIMLGRIEWLAQTQRLTAFAGRETELNQIKAIHEMILQGRGQAVLLSGEPGIGKSRLVYELKKGTHTIGTNAIFMPGNPAPVLWLESRCQPRYQETSLYPIIRVLEGLLGFRGDDSLQVRQEKMAGMLAGYGLSHPSTAWLLSHLLGLSAEMLDPQGITKAQREQMCTIFITLLQKRASEQPLVLVVEDLHWGDPTSMDWLGQASASIARVSCLMLLTARPEFKPARFFKKDSLSTLHTFLLSPLQIEQVEQMVTDLAGEQGLDEEIRRSISTQTDGIPLFVEELTKSLLQQPIQAGKANNAMEIPPTLHDTLLTRLDHVGVAKETAQWAAALGREFIYPILQACVPYSEQRLQSDLTCLIENELVIPARNISAYSEPTGYAFKHGLIQEAAHASMLEHTRQVYHRRIAEVIETRFPHIAETQPEVLAQHYSSAGLQTKAIDYLLIAGENAATQGATLEARTFFDRAIKSITPEDGDRRWRALKGREQVLDKRGERAAQKEALAALMDLAESFNDDIWRAQVYLLQTAYFGMQGDFRATLPPAEQARAAAHRAGNLALEMHALAFKAQSLMFFREIATARQVVEEMLAQVSKVEDESVRAEVLTVAAYYYLESGDFVQSVRLQVQSLDAAHRAGNRSMESTIYANLGLIYATLGLYPLALTTLETALALAELLSNRRLHASVLRHLGYVHWCMGERKLAQQIEKESLNELSAVGDAYGEAACLAYLGYILESAGESASAEKYLTKARAVYTEIGIELDKFEAQAVEARVLLAQGQREAAQQLAIEAWEYLCKQGTEGMDSPFLMYVCVADVLEEVETPGISLHDVIETGHHELMERADKISDAEWRRSFLENVAENRSMVERWNKLSRQS